MSSRQKLLYTIVVFGCGIVAGLGGDQVSHNLFSAISVSSNELRMVDRHGVRLTSPLLECTEQPERYYQQNLTELEGKVSDLIAQGQKSRDITYASVYFRDLNNGPWFGVNESDEFFPASLLKLPLAMSFYWAAEDDPSIFTKEVTYTPDPSTNTQTQPYGPKQNVVDGQKYTVKDLIKITLQESSNEAAISLANLAGPEQIFSVYKDLGLKPPVLNQDYQIDTHTYASFFRILYNATYLDRAASEEVLSLLTQTSFTEGLVAGLPANTLAAHKFGSRMTADGKDQLHDCGVIYAPERPYILCVMTQGTDFTKLAGFIKTVSRVVYDQVTEKK